jgi:hypothetical protein
MRILPGLALTGFGTVFAYGWALRLLPKERRTWLDLALVTLALSLGGLTLWMFWVALLLPGRLNLATALAGPAALGGIGLWAIRRHSAPHSLESGTTPSSGVLDAVLVCLVSLTCAAILFNSVYWPFSEEDALAIYAPLAKRIYRTGALPVGGRLYEAYPMALPLAYAYTHWAAGAVNEYLARLVPGLLGAGVLGVTALLGRELLSARTGWLAAALLGLTPAFCRWASSGYADVPASFYFTMSALFAWRWCRDARAEDGLLAGVMAGLAMWTKNSALTLVVSLPVLVALRWWMARVKYREPLRRLPWRQIALSGGAVVAIALPWYLRNLVLFDFLFPPPWTYRVQHDLETLLAMTTWRSWAVSGWLFSASIACGLIAALRGGKKAKQWALLLIYTLPFYAAWWWMADYDPRLLMVTTPLLAVMAALMLENLAQILRVHLTAAWFRLATTLVAVALISTAPFSLRQAVQHKPVIVIHPLSTDAEKHRVCLGGLYDLAKAINRLPPGSRIAGVPGMSRYHVDLERLVVLPDVNLGVPPEKLSVECDYAVYRFPEGEKPDWALGRRWLFRTADGYWLCATKERAERTR